MTPARVPPLPLAIAARSMLPLLPDHAALFRGELRQSAQSRDELPDLFLAPRRAEGGHAGHADSIRDDPFELAVRAGLNAREGEAYGRRVQARTSLRRVDSRSSVTNDAVGLKQRESRGDGRGRLSEGIGHLRSVARDRAIEGKGGQPLLEPSRRFRG